MAKNSITDYDNTSGNNTDVQSVDISEGCSPSGINNAIREVMADLADVNDGTVALTSPQAANMTVTGTVTTDTIAENTSAAGVTIDGVLLKDGGVGSATAAITAYLSSLNGGQLGGNRNLIINGNMAVSQRTSSAVTVNSPTRTYAVDRFFGFGTSSAGVFTEEQSTDVPSGERFHNSSKITVTTNSSPSGSQTYGWGQGIEGLNTASLMFGSSNAMTVTLSFWIKSSLTGTFSVILANYGGTRTYPATYTISSANTWEYQTITVAGDQSGTWNTDNTEGLSVLWMLGTGSSLHGTANAWGASKFGVSGQTDLIATNGATLYITGVQLEVGEATPFEHRSYGDELARCQRYYEQMSGGGGDMVSGVGQAFNSSSGETAVIYKVEKRVAPTITTSGSFQIWIGNGSASATSNAFAEVRTTQATWQYGGGSAGSIGQAIQFYADGGTATVKIDAEL